MRQRQGQHDDDSGCEDAAIRDGIAGQWSDARDHDRRDDQPIAVAGKLAALAGKDLEQLDKAERHDRQAQAAYAHRDQSHQPAGEPSAGQGQRNAGDERDADISEQDQHAVAAHAHEGRTGQRQHTGDAVEQVQADHRDDQHAKLRHQEARIGVQQAEAGGQKQGNSDTGQDKAHQTRRNCRDPNRPEGRSMSISISRPKTTTSR